MAALPERAALEEAPSAGTDLPRYRQAFDLVGGVTLMATGLYLLNAYYFLIPSLAG